MTPSEEDILKAWVESEADKVKRLLEITRALTAPQEFIEALIYNQVTPYYHYRINYIEHQEDKLFHADRETSEGASGSPVSTPVAVQGKVDSQTAAAQSAPSLPKCVKCGNEFAPKTFGAKLCLDCWKRDHPYKRR